MEPRSIFDVEIVIPAYKAERTIGRTIDSLLAQEGVGCHVIVVVDGVFDGTVDVVSRYPGERVTMVVEEVNGGASRSRNRGLDLVQAEFVMFIDADDFVEGDFLRPLLARMRSAGADMGFAPLQILLEREGRRLPRFAPEWRSSPEVFRDWHGREHFVGTVGTMWRTQFLRGIGGWDPEITRNDDGELAMRGILMGAKFTVSPSGQGVYVHHASDTLNQRTDNMDSMLRANRKLMAIRSPVVDQAEQRRVCGEHYLSIACHAYLAGRDELGDSAFAESRALGVVAKGSWPYQIGFRLLGPRRLSRSVRWLKRRLGRESG
ncbi:MAG TPA: glycosyltransferase [Allosphingosinicella sp.]